MSFSIPARAMQAVRPSACRGLLAVSAVVATVFTAAPFAIEAVSDRYGVSTGAAGLTSTAQMGGFTVASLLAGRRLRASARLATTAAVGLIVVNAVSAMTPWFSVLVVARGLSGVAMAVLTWIAWADSASNGRRRGEVAAVGPLAAAISAPLIAVVTDLGGVVGLYALLAAVGLVALLVPVTVEGPTAAPLRAAHRRRSTGATLTVLALGLFTMGGSAVFIFATVIGRQQVGLSAFAVSLAFSLNAVAGIPAARFAGRRRVPGAWMAATAICSLAVTLTHDPIVFFVAMTLWGLAFWVAVPEAFSILADRSASPDERVGDAQAVMSIGRIVGPVVGGGLLQGGSLVTLGVASAVVTIAAAVAVEAIATAHRWWDPVPARGGAVSVVLRRPLAPSPTPGARHPRQTRPTSSRPRSSRVPADR